MKKWFSFLTVVLAACGGDSGGGTAQLVPMTGSVSQGFPIAGAVVTLVDAKGNEVSAGITDDVGNYLVPDISGLTAPIVVKASGTTGGYATTLYGMLGRLGTSNVANVTPLTDAVLVQALGKSPTLLLSEANGIAGIDLGNVDNVAARMAMALSNVMEQITRGSSQGFNPLNTPFVADGVSAADKVNDLIKVTTTFTTTGVETDLIDKSNNVGSVTVTNQGAVDKLRAVPDSVASVNISRLKKTVDLMTAAFSTEASIDSTALDNLFADDYFEDGKNKSDQIGEFRSFKDILAGTIISNPKIITCKTDQLCSLRLTLKGPVINESMDVWTKYDASKGFFRLYGNQFKFKAYVDSHVNRSVNLKDNTTFTQAALSVTINSDKAGWDAYETAKAEFVASDGSVDLTYLYKLKRNNCYPGKPGSFYYDGMPRDDNSDRCWHGQMFETSNEQQLKTINAKIKQGGYKVVVKAWKNSGRTGEPDVVEIPLSEPVATTDRIADNGYPRVKRETGSGSSLPYLLIENADDFVVTGSLCISKNNWCDVETTQVGSTTTLPKGRPALARKIQAEAADGWKPGDPVRAFFIHVMDKAGRDMILSGNTN